jgi:hypothetical protein
MSHKASAYMRELTKAPNGEFLTRNEKLFGLILADYHQAGTRHTFPSLSTLAADCLMDERSARRVLHSMERKGIVKRIRPVFQYRGITTFYIFPAIDGDQKEDTATPLKEGGQKEGRRRAEGGQKGDKTLPPYKEELVTVTIKPTTPLPPSPQAAKGGKLQDIAPVSNGTPPKTTPRKKRIAEALSVLEVHLVMRKCGWSDPNLAPVILEALEQFRRQKAIPISEAAQQMAHNWGVYTDDARFLRYVCTARNWINKGHWCNPGAWPYDQQLIEAYKNARVGSNTIH